MVHVLILKQFVNSITQTMKKVNTYYIRNVKQRNNLWSLYNHDPYQALSLCLCATALAFQVYTKYLHVDLKLSLIL